MKNYNKPTMKVTESAAECVYAAGSGRGRCSKDRTEFSPTVDRCQECFGGNYKEDVPVGAVCPEGMPTKVK